MADEKEKLRQEYVKLEELRSAMTTKRTPEKSGGKQGNIEVVKSPSDTTIYAPALSRKKPDVVRTILNNDTEEFRSGLDPIREDKGEDGFLSNENNETNKISDFVEEMRLQFEKNRMDDQSQRVNKDAEPQPLTSRQDAKVAADKIVVKAEQFRAVLEKPKVRVII